MLPEKLRSRFKISGSSEPYSALASAGFHEKRRHDPLFTFGPSIWNNSTFISSWMLLIAMLRIVCSILLSWKRYSPIKRMCRT